MKDRDGCAIVMACFIGAIVVMLLIFIFATGVKYLIEAI